MSLRVAWLALGLVACGDSASAPDVDAGPDAATAPGAADEIDAIPFPTTIELDDDAMGALDRSDDDGTLRFGSTPAVLRDVAVGRIVVAGVGKHTPAGVLRVVLAVEPDGDALTLRTAQVPIQLAFRQLHLRTARTVAATSAAGASTQALSLPSARSFKSFAAPIAGGSFDRMEPFDYVLFDGDADTSTTDDQIAIDGELGGGFDYELGVDVDWGDVTDLPDAITSCLESLAGALVGQAPDCSVDSLLPEAKVSFDVHPTVHADANVHGAAILEYEKEVDLASTTLAPIVLGPIVLVPVVDLTAQLSGGASAQFTAGIHGSAVFATSVSVSSRHPGMARVSEPELVSTDFGPNDVQVSLHAEAKVGIGARLNLLLFGVTGPYATARAYGALAADLLQSPCWSLHAGVDLELGIEVTSPALPLIGHVTLIDWQAPTLTPLDVEIATGECDAVTDAPELPPGAGPDAARLARPTFTPWSRSYGPAFDGAIAGSPGNNAAFADVQHTIDGRTVRGGYGVQTLTKIDDEDGHLVWARALELDGEPLQALRVLPANDASLAVVSNAIAAQIVLSRVAQDGEVLGARAFDVPLDVCTVDITGLASDASGGFYVAGACVGAHQSFLLHASRDDTDDALWLLDAGEINAFEVRVAAGIEGDAFVSGTMNDGLDAMFALRVRPDGTLAYAKRYAGCAEAWDALPSQALVGEQGEVTLAGSGGAVHNGILARLRADGSVGFATFPGFGFGAGSVFVLDSIAKLPTTGYVAGGSFVRFSGMAPEDVPSAALVGFDAAGRLAWAQRYGFVRDDGLVASGQVAVHLTDDGGVLATALVADPADPLGGSLWAFKAFAKDGSIAFEPGTVEQGPLEITDLDCTLTDADLELAPRSAPELSARSASVVARAIALTEQEQTVAR